MRAVRVRTPHRIDLAGGTLDIWPLHLVLPLPAVTVNAALDLHVEASVVPNTGGTARIRLVSIDQEREAKYPDLDSLAEALAEGTCPVPLLGHAALAGRPETGFTLTTSSEGPTGAGLGGSSALICAVLGALAASSGRAFELGSLQILAQDVETRLLGSPTGYQDYFPALHGGCLALEGGVGGVVVERLSLAPAKLEERLRLADTGAPHKSGITNWGVVRAFLDGEARTVEALQALAEISRGVRDALHVEDLDRALALVIEDGRVRREMAPGVTTPEIEALNAAVREAGALGTKICGAGGGGCVLVVLDDPDAGGAVDAALEAGPWRRMPISLSPEGITLSEPHEDGPGAP